MGWACGMGKIGNAYKMLVRKFVGKIQLWRLRHR
jgi:hypothetical protein